ncbi:MAG TPA: hypothetical protein VFQ35_13075 [Polyangiaceae bacterium]|nr:hypothetical protein [Polyangiaceae bacterium]
MIGPTWKLDRPHGGLPGTALPWYLAPVSFSSRSTLAGGLVAFALFSFAPSSARADVSSWAYAGLGPGFLRDDRQRLTLQLDAGIGTPPATLVVGGVFRAQPYFKSGTDLALLARVATRGDVQGGFGLALDAGGYERFWGRHSEGGLAALNLGAPWGITLSVTGGMGTHDERFASFTLGFDFARLTVYRTTGTNWFSNPFATDDRGRGPR